MVVIPSLNCGNPECTREKTRVLNSIHASWVHIDVADGIFAPVVLSEDAAAIKKIFEEEEYWGSVEVHLMVAHPERWVRAWLECGARRILVHAEVVSNVEIFKKIKSECDSFGAELGIVVQAMTPEMIMEPLLAHATFWTILAVPVGFSGGVFEEEYALKKILFLRKRIPGVVIEVDGGMNLKTGVLVKNTGADIIISGAFIFSHNDPGEAFRTLENL